MYVIYEMRSDASSCFSFPWTMQHIAVKFPDVGINRLNIGQLLLSAAADWKDIS